MEQKEIINRIRRAEKEGVDLEGDPLNENTKRLVAGLVNEKMLSDTAKECQATVAAADDPSLRAPTVEQLKEWQDWAFEYKKRNPLASPARVAKAVSNHFNIRILPDQK